MLTLLIFMVTVLVGIMFVSVIGSILVWMLGSIGDSFRSEAITRELERGKRENAYADTRIAQLTKLQSNYWFKREAIGEWRYYDEEQRIPPSFHVWAGHEAEDETLWEEHRKVAEPIEDELLDWYEQRGQPRPAFIEHAHWRREREKKHPKVPASTETVENAPEAMARRLDHEAGAQVIDISPAQRVYLFLIVGFMVVMTMATVVLGIRAALS